MVALVLAVGPWVAVTLITALVARRALARFFGSLVIRSGPADRQRPPIRFGLEMDDLMVGPWDFLPAWRALRTPLHDPKLDRDRRVAGLMTLPFFLLLPVGIIGARVTSSAIGIDPWAPSVIWFMTWAVAQAITVRPALWFSRPQLRDWGIASMRGALIIVAIVGGTLALALAVIIVVQALRPTG